jgi:ABC-type sulfate/molybdate transport systems ATPase subunit
VSDTNSHPLTVSVRHRISGFSLEAEFTLYKGWTILFGPSGAGKSTLLRILAGLTTPDSGHITFDGRTLLSTAQKISVAPGHRRIGFVTQQAALFPHLTARENIAFGIRHLSQTQRTERIEELLHLFSAAHLADRKPASLSGGERQRIALARALAPRPHFLLLDEPLAALDAAAGEQLLAGLRALEIPTLYVSHDVAEVWQANAAAIVLEAGHIRAHGPAREVLAPHRDRLLRQLSDSEGK